MRPGWLLLLALGLASCASGPRARVANAAEQGDVDGALGAYEELRRSEGADRDLLGRIAAAILAREARSDDAAARRAALLQLSLAGTRGAPILTAIANEEGIGPARLGALEVLARRGREEARFALRALSDSEDLEVVAASVLGMDAELDRALLRELLDSTHPGVRAAAARALGPAAAEHAEVLASLGERARVDPEASVRAAAARALGHGGVGALEALRERLSDPESSVRLAAVGALIEADREAGLRSLGPLLEVDPSPAGIEAARLIAQLDGETEDGRDAANARAFLRRALFAESAGLRSQAGVALAGLPERTEAPLAAVAEALERERDPEVRLSFARALLRADAAAARAALVGLLDADGMPRVQAASLLATDGHERAAQILSEVVASDAASILRRTAVRALAREARRPDAARRALTDEDRDVRIYAAGGILAAAAAG